MLEHYTVTERQWKDIEEARLASMLGWKIEGFQWNKGTDGNIHITIVHKGGYVA